MGDLQFRLATPADAKQIVDLYSYYVEQTVITFEDKLPSVDEFASRIERISSTYPYLVCERAGNILGWAYASRFREREAYRFDVETSIYVASEEHSHGIGAALYDSLLPILQAQGYINAYAGIALPNVKSVRLHERHGFEHAGVWEKVGFKHGKWIDVMWMRKQLGEYSQSPREPMLISELTPALEGLLRRNSRILRV